MAKNTSLFKIEGSLDEITFYKTADGHYVRMKGGISKDRIMNDPSFVRTRENMSEFAHLARTGKYFRQAIGGLLQQAKDNKLTGRMTRTFSAVKKLDYSSSRGQRQVGIGMATPQGKQLLKGFDFNRHAPLMQVVLKPVAVDTATAAFTITDLVPLEDLRVPEGATHVHFSGAHLNYDFATHQSDLQMCQMMEVPLDMQTYQVSVAPQQLAAGNGLSFFLFFVSFYQEMNGHQYSLRNGMFNVLHIVDVV